MSDDTPTRREWELAQDFVDKHDLEEAGQWPPDLLPTKLAELLHTYGREILPEEALEEDEPDRWVRLSEVAAAILLDSKVGSVGDRVIRRIKYLANEREENGR